eukprot:6173095-Pleurochrysis_carterae.AAC.1
MASPLLLLVTVAAAVAAAELRGTDPLKSFKIELSPREKELEERYKAAAAARRLAKETGQGKAPEDQTYRSRVLGEAHKAIDDPAKQGQQLLKSSGRNRLPLAVVITGSAGAIVWRSVQARHLGAAVQREWQSLRSADPTLGRSASGKLALKLPSTLASRRRLRDELRRRRALLQEIVKTCNEIGQRPPVSLAELSEIELRGVVARLSLLSQHILPAYTQLEENPVPNLCWKSAGE